MRNLRIYGPLYFMNRIRLLETHLAPSIYAAINLTILGDVTADLIEVKGDLFVLGHVKFKTCPVR